MRTSELGYKLSNKYAQQLAPNKIQQLDINYINALKTLKDFVSTLDRTIFLENYSQLDLNSKLATFRKAYQATGQLAPLGNIAHDAIANIFFQWQKSAEQLAQSK